MDDVALQSSTLDNVAGTVAKDSSVQAAAVSLVKAASTASGGYWTSAPSVSTDSLLSNFNLNFKQRRSRKGLKIYTSLLSSPFSQRLGVQRLQCLACGRLASALSVLLIVILGQIPCEKLITFRAYSEQAILAL